MQTRIVLTPCLLAESDDEHDVSTNFHIQILRNKQQREVHKLV